MYLNIDLEDVKIGLIADPDISEYIQYFVKAPPSHLSTSFPEPEHVYFPKDTEAELYFHVDYVRLYFI